MAGILPTAPGIAVTILLARLSHFVVGVVLVMVLFGPLWVAQAVEAYLPGIMASRENIDGRGRGKRYYGRALWLGDCGRHSEVAML